MLVRMWNNSKSEPLLVETQNGADTLWDSLAFSRKIKHSLITWSNNHAPWCLPKGVKTLCSHKNWHTDVPSSCVHNFQHLKPTTLPFSRWVGRETVVHPDNGISSMLKRHELSSHGRLWRKLKYILISEESLHAVWFQLHSWHSGTGKIMEEIKRSVVASGLSWWWMGR